MKKILFTLLTLTCILSACSSTSEKLVSEYESKLGKCEDVQGSMYTWKNISKETFYKNGPKLKDTTDKIVGMLPTKTHDQELSAATGSLYSSYTWESPQIKVVLWLDYQEGKEFIQLVIKKK